MPTPPDLDTVAFICEDGSELSVWTEITISDDFLSPCQTVSLSVAADESRFDLTQKIRVGSEFLVTVNGNPTCGGFVDSVEVDGDRSGVRVNVTGRDVLSPAVDSNINPRLAVKKTMSLVDLAELVFLEEFRLPVLLVDDTRAIDAGRDLALGRPIKTQPRKGKRGPRDPLKEIFPHPNEGGFAYVMRFAHRIGFHCWAMPDGQGVIIGTPTYGQEPAYALTRLRGQQASGVTNIERGKLRFDNTHVPSHVFVRGKGSKPGDKSNPIGFARYESAPLFKPFYVTDDESTDKAHADTVARFVLGKALRTAFCYEVTVRGLSDPATGRVYTVDTVAAVNDQVCGPEGPMWVESRTFRKSRGGTFTDMRLLPADALLLDYYASESPPPPPESYKAAGAQMSKKKVSQREPTGFELAYAAIWGAERDSSGKRFDDGL